MLMVLQKHCLGIAVPIGTAAIDENTIHTKARCKGRTFMPNKPDKYGICLYSTVSSHPGVYLHNFSDNHSGNNSEDSAAVVYCHVFPQLRTVHDKHIAESKVIDPN